MGRLKSLLTKDTYVESPRVTNQLHTPAEEQCETALDSAICLFAGCAEEELVKLFKSHADHRSRTSKDHRLKKIKPRAMSAADVVTAITRALKVTQCGSKEEDLISRYLQTNVDYIKETEVQRIVMLEKFERELDIVIHYNDHSRMDFDSMRELECKVRGLTRSSEQFLAAKQKLRIAAASSVTVSIDWDLTDMDTKPFTLGKGHKRAESRW
jgi:hypothetical protein